MENGTYAQINYNPDNPDDVFVTEVKSPQPEPSPETEEQISKESEEESNVSSEPVEEPVMEEKPAEKEEPAFEEERPQEEAAAVEEEPSQGAESGSEEEPPQRAESGSEEEPSREAESGSEEEPFQEAESGSEEEASQEQETVSEPEPIQEEEPVQEGEQVSIEETVQKEAAANENSASEELREELARIREAGEDIQYTLRRLERKFSDEILNGENRDSSVKTIYKELNEYKAGIVEKALKNVLYDIVDIRELILSQARYLREKKGAETISLEEFESYADDIGDILEKHDVTIYKGEPGRENVAVRQKIVRKIETEEDSLVKKVAESLSYGYEYGGKILYPERISVYVKKK